MIKVFDFECELCRFVFEKWTKAPHKAVACPRCESTKTRRLPAAPKINLPGHDESFPSAALKWERWKCAPGGPAERAREI